MTPVDERLLQSYRINKRKTQQEIADETGIHVQQISRYERREATPTLEIAVKLAKAYGVTLEEIANYFAK